MEPRRATGFIVPVAGRSMLRSPAEARGYRDDPHARFVDVGPLSMPHLAPHALDLERDLLVHLDGRRRVHLVRGLTTGSPREEIVKVGWFTTLHAVAIVDSVVYLGGEGGKGFVAWLDPDGDRRVQPLAMPPNLLTFGKGVDGFAVHEGKLVAVDDIVLPRYLLIYDVRDPRDPKLLEARLLPAHSSAERVIAVAADGATMAILSTSANHGHQAQHVAVYDLATLAERATLHTERPGSFRSSGAPRVELASVAVDGETIRIAAGKDGVAVLDARPWPPSANARGAVIPFEALRWVPVAGEVVRVVPVGPAAAFAVLGGRRAEAVLVEVPGHA